MPGPAAGIMDTARTAMAEAVTFALEIDIVLDVRTGGLAIEVPVKYAGDLHAIGYSSADLTITIPFQVIESKLITSGGTNYLFDPVANKWEVLPGDSPFFAGPSVSLGSDATDTTDLNLLRSETIDGVETHVVSAMRPGVEIGGATGDLEVLYWIGVDDGLLRKVEANGLVEFGEEGVPGLDFSIANANANLTARFFDYGKTVDIITPELATSRVDHKAFLLDDGRVLVTGGFTNMAINDFIAPFLIETATVYNPETGLWLLEDPISQVEDGLSLHSAVKLQDGRILTVGLRREGEEIVGGAAAFDPAVGSWASLPPPSTPRGLPTVVLLAGGRVLVTGGWTSGSFDPDSMGPTEIFHPETSEWRQAAPMNQSVEGQAAALMLDGRVLVVGGTANARDGIARADIYDPDTDTWTPAESMSTERVRPEVVLLADGRVLVTGDDPNAIGAMNGSAEIYDQDTGSWTSIADLSHPRIGHTLTLLPDGRVLAAGGADPAEIDHAVYSTTEIYDPETDRWTPGPDLSGPRYFHSATLMPDGRVLLIGGIGLKDEQYPLISSEFVTP